MCRVCPRAFRLPSGPMNQKGWGASGCCRVARGQHMMLSLTHHTVRTAPLIITTVDDAATMCVMWDCEHYHDDHSDSSCDIPCLCARLVAWATTLSHFHHHPSPFAERVDEGIIQCSKIKCLGVAISASSLFHWLASLPDSLCVHVLEDMRSAVL